MILSESSNTAGKETLNFSVPDKNKQILRPTRCPTIVCKECKINYADRLGLDIFVICNCKCHSKRENR